MTHFVPYTTLFRAADHDQQARLAVRVVDLPVHAVGAGQRAELLAQGGFGHRGGQVEVHAQEEAAAFVVAALLRIEDVAAQLEPQRSEEHTSELKSQMRS